MRKLFSKLLVIVGVALSLTACLGGKNEIKDDAVFLQSAPVCTSDDMCKKMWEAAGAWVDKYSPQGIETYSDDLIQSEEKELGSDEMEITVRKIKQDDGSYKILIDNLCSRTLGSCTAERSNMIAFNKKLSGFMTTAAKNKVQKVIEDNSEVKQWLERYTQLTAGFKADALATMLHFPVSFIEKDEIIVLKTTDDLKTYLQNLKAQFDKVNGIYLKTDSIDVFARHGRNLYVNAIINLYDIENTIVAAQQIGFHLVYVDHKWQMISAAKHGE